MFNSLWLERSNYGVKKASARMHKLYMGLKILKHRYSKDFQTILQEITRISAQCLYQTVRRELPQVCKSIEMGEKLTNKDSQAILEIATKAIKE